MIIIDLFSGTEGFSAAFKEDEKHDVFTVDNNKKHNADLQKDILDISADELPDADVVLASPPCTKFSMASMRWYWDKEDGKYIPTKEDSEKAAEAEKHLKFVEKTLKLINEINPDFWFMENPRAMLRKIAKQEFDVEPRGTITWCQYWTEKDNKLRGVPVMKPTDLWGEHPDNFEYKSCKNGADCHESAPRGSDKGTQGKENSELRGSIPYGLSKSIKNSVEKRKRKCE